MQQNIVEVANETRAVALFEFGGGGGGGVGHSNSSVRSRVIANIGFSHASV